MFPAALTLCRTDDERSPFTDPQKHLEFLTDLLSRVDTQKSPEAHVLLLASIANAKLLYGDLEGTKTDIDGAWKILDELTGVDNSVNAAYYGVAAEYYKVRSRPCGTLNDWRMPYVVWASTTMHTDALLAPDKRRLCCLLPQLSALSRMH